MSRERELICSSPNVIETGDVIAEATALSGLRKMLYNLEIGLGKSRYAGAGNWVSDQYEEISVKIVTCVCRSL